MFFLYIFLCIFYIGKNRQVAKIQKAWSVHRAYQFQQAILAKEENARLMRVLALVVRCRWRAKNAKKIRNFCIDYSTVCSKLNSKIENN